MTVKTLVNAINANPHISVSIIDGTTREARYVGLYEMTPAHLLDLDVNHFTVVSMYPPTINGNPPSVNYMRIYLQPGM